VQSDKPVNLALVGAWDQFPAEYERLNKIIAELGLTERVSWEGFAHYGKDLFEQIDRSDVLVLPSLSEGSPHVLIEARARSLPIIATRVGGIPDSVTDGEDGLLVPPRDPHAIARALSRIINDAAFRQKLIRQGRERVSKLTIEWFVDLVMDLLTLPEAELRERSRNAGAHVGGSELRA
jgi:glycosyltransferase involved in cell wall biosynthesis